MDMDLLVCPNLNSRIVRSKVEKKGEKTAVKFLEIQKTNIQNEGHKDPKTRVPTLYQIRKAVKNEICTLFIQVKILRLKINKKNLLRNNQNNIRTAISRMHAAYLLYGNCIISGLYINIYIHIYI